MPRYDVLDLAEGLSPEQLKAFTELVVPFLRVLRRIVIALYPPSPAEAGQLPAKGGKGKK